MNVFKCDVCGKETYINPKVRPKLDSNGKQIIKKEVIAGLLKETPLFEEEQERAYIVRLSVGMTDVIQKDFCKEHLEDIMPELTALRNKLLSISDK
jgi:hypothetical protein